MGSRRSKLEIIYDMLKSIQEKNGRIKPTHLLYKSNLSYNKMKDYLDELLKNQMILEEKTKDGTHYTLTDNGVKFINDFKRIKEFSDSFGL